MYFRAKYGHILSDVCPNKISDRSGRTEKDQFCLSSAPVQLMFSTWRFTCTVALTVYRHNIMAVAICMYNTVWNKARNGHSLTDSLTHETFPAVSATPINLILLNQRDTRASPISIYGLAHRPCLYYAANSRRQLANFDLRHQLVVYLFIFPYIFIKRR